MAPTNAVAKTAELLTIAGSNAGRPDPAPSPIDVWKHSYNGMSERVRNADPLDVMNSVQTLGAADSIQGIGQGLQGDWSSSSLGGVGDGLSQQASEIAKQARLLTHTSEDGKPPEGVLQHVGAAFGMLTGIEQLVTLPLSAIPMPAFPAVRVFDMDVGLPHAHMHPPNLTPPNPVPVPLPSTGPVIPIPLLSGANTVLINGMPAARCGDLGLGVWCGGYFPMFEIFLGSSSVWIDGCRAARVGIDITKHCIFTTPRPSDPPVGPMIGMTTSSSPNVLIGGVPVPSLTSMAMGKAFKAMFKGLGKAAAKAKSVRTRTKAYGPKGPPAPSSPVGYVNWPPALVKKGEEIIDGLRKSGKLVIEGNEAFVDGVMNDLRMIGATKTGRQVLNELKDSGKKVTIRGGEPPGCRSLREPAQYQFDAPGGSRPGAGSNSGVQYTPGQNLGPQTPSDAVLLHELGHARNAARGEQAADVGFSNPSDRARWSDMEEMQTIQNLENPYRAERGLDPRQGHSHTP